MLSTSAASQCPWLLHPPPILRHLLSILISSVSHCFGLWVASAVSGLLLTASFPWLSASSHPAGSPHYGRWAWVSWSLSISSVPQIKHVLETGLQANGLAVVAAYSSGRIRKVRYTARPLVFGACLWVPLQLWRGRHFSRRALQPRIIPSWETSLA